MKVFVSTIRDLASLQGPGPEVSIYNSQDIKSYGGNKILYIHDPSAVRNVLDRLVEIMSLRKECMVFVSKESGEIERKSRAVGKAGMLGICLDESVDAATEYINRLSPLTQTLSVNSSIVLGYLCNASGESIRKFADIAKMKYGLSLNEFFGDHFEADDGYFLIGGNRIKRVTNFKVLFVAKKIYNNGIDTYPTYYISTDRFGDFSMVDGMTSRALRMKRLGMYVSSIDDFMSVMSFADIQERQLETAGIHGNILRMPDTIGETVVVPPLSGFSAERSPIRKEVVKSIKENWAIIEAADRILDVMYRRDLWFFWCPRGDGISVVKKAAELLGYSELVGCSGKIDQFRVKGKIRKSDFFPQFIIVPKLDSNVMSYALSAFAGSVVLESPMIVVFRSLECRKDHAVYRVPSASIPYLNYGELSWYIYMEIEKRLPDKISIKEVIGNL